MKLKCILFIFFFSQFAGSSSAQNYKAVVELPSLQQEASSVWRTIRDISFFERAGYTVHLPQDPLIDSLILKSKNGSFGNDDFSSIFQLLESSIYQEKEYAAALQKVKAQLPLINQMIQEIAKTKDSWNWDFKMYDTYRVVLTLYGSGGSYDPDQGVITLFTTTDGVFKNYTNPANTIIHEVVHIGIEQSLIQNLKLSHVRKERTVDKMVKILFGDRLPNYRVQNMGDTEVDTYLKEKKDLQNLHRGLSKLAE
ncbi:MAG: hypothetical protein AAFU64_02225 [Bacteroidota bacterium]